MNGVRLGIDIGGTKTHAVLLGPRGAVAAEATLPTRPGASGVIETALAVADVVRTRAGLSPDAAGVGVPGVVDGRTGHVASSVNLAITTLALGPALEAEWGVPVTVANDVKAAAVGARHVLGLDDLSYLNVGTGVSAASLVRGALVQGLGNVAGEIGHLTLDPDGELCRCGQRGCIEMWAGGRGISDRLRPYEPQVSLANLVDAAASGHTGAQRELARVTHGIAGAVRVLVLALGSPKVVLAGGVITHGGGLVDHVRQHLAEEAAASTFMRDVDLAGRIATLPPGYAAGAMGSALLNPDRAGS